MSNTITITAATGEDMQALGERLAKLARGGDVLLLSGPLGAGKTTFAQGFGAGLGIGEPIVSPTFTIARELEGRFADGSPAHLVHVDAYRLGGNSYAPGQDTVGRLLDELESLGLDEELEDPGEHTVILMEWGEQMAAALVRSVCSFFLLPRRFTALLVAMSYIMLSACVFPSDSVSRALLMGLSGAACLFIGRRGQAMASLSWTTLAMLMACPHMSQSFGFALSCAAVLGIVLFADTLNAWMEPVLPRFVAEALSMTIAAQVFTLPIQVLIEPELPVFSIPANLMVAPFVGFATLAGLASLAVSWLIPWLGLQLARAASWGTAVMELTALELGSGSQATIPWAGGVGGAVLVCVVEAACAAAAIMTHRLFGQMMVQEPDLPGKRLIANPVERLRMWMERTRKALRELQWEE